ncbi:MAG: DUF4176 domain-containing protein [Eubacterium sp.]|nr:DUF4176 domain-containing protein [Eubacterium sp.]
MDGVLEKYLPLGSIVVLNGSVKKLMITARGVLTGEGENRRIYDYGAALYPEGVMDEKMLFFDQKDIYRIVFEGYTDMDDEIMNDTIKKWVKSKIDEYNT